MKFITKAVLATLLLAFNTASAGFVVELKEFNRFNKSSSTIQNLDKDNFAGTAFTNQWRYNKQYNTYGLGAELLWMAEDGGFYAKVDYKYGWITHGRAITYPVRWSSTGHSNDYNVEAGYLIDFCERFTLIPHIGYTYSTANTKLKDQTEFHQNPSSFVSQNGNKTDDKIWFPYIGLEIDFKYKLCDCYDIQLFTNYEFGYGGGKSNVSVPHFIATDDPNTSRYGSHTKYRGLITHDFEVGAGYNLNESWLLGVTLDYINTYNTHKNPVKFQRNSELVAAGQFTATQYHRVSDFSSQTYAITFSLVYSFSGKGGIWIR